MARHPAKRPLPILPTPRGHRRGLTPAGIGALLLVVVFVACVGSLPWSAGRVESSGGAPVRRYEAGNLDLALAPPSWWESTPESDVAWNAEAAAGQYVPTRILGTDRLGRDVLARLLVGGAISLMVGVVAAIVAVGVGSLYGALAAASGGRVDAVLMRGVDVLYGLPSILLIVMLAVAAEGALERMGVRRGGWTGQALDLVVLLLAIAATSWLTVARVIRGQVLSLRAQPFMEACRAIGVGWTRQFRLHYLPNIVAPVVVYGALAIPAAILSESFLSFLGIGVREPLPSWGNLAADGLSEVNTIRSRWWLLLWPCMAVGMTLLALNFVADGVRARVDPASRGRSAAT